MTRAHFQAALPYDELGEQIGAGGGRPALDAQGRPAPEVSGGPEENGLACSCSESGHPYERGYERVERHALDARAERPERY